MANEPHAVPGGRVRWSFDAAPPPAALYIGRDDRILVRVFNSNSGQDVGVEARLLTPAPELSPQAWTLTGLTTDRAVNEFYIDLAEGFLLTMQVRPRTGTPRRGQLYVQAGLGRGSSGAWNPMTILCQGYLTTTLNLAWPPAPIEPSERPPGQLRSIAGTDPAAGVEISETVPTNARWRLLAIRYALVTDSTVATRTSRIILDDGATIYHVAEFGATQAASATVNYGGAVHTAYKDSSIPTNNIMIPLPDLWLFQGHRIRTITNNLQAGDNHGAPQLLVEELIEE